MVADVVPDGAYVPIRVPGFGRRKRPKALISSRIIASEARNVWLRFA